MIRTVQYGRAADVKDKKCRKEIILYFRMWALMDEKGVTKHNYGKYMKTALWFSDNKFCLCNGKKWSNVLLGTTYKKERTFICKLNGITIASRVLGQLFGICTDRT